MTDGELIQRASELVHTTAQSTYEPVVIFGASFNPITLGHLALIRALLHDPIIKDQHIYLIPARQSPLKSAQIYASAADRLCMLALAIEHHIDPTDRARLSIQTVELDRPEPSRMSVTLALLTLQHQARQRYTLVCGYDHLAGFNQWYQWSAFKDLCTLMFYPREGITLLDVASMATLRQLLQAGIKVTIVCSEATQLTAAEAYCQQNMGEESERVKWVYNPSIKIPPSNATDIRAYYRQHRGEAMVAIPKDLTPEVHYYIQENSCY